MEEKKNYPHAVMLHLVRDPGVPDEDLARSLADWKRLKDSGSPPPDWGREPDGTLDGFLRLIVKSGSLPDIVREAVIKRRAGGTILDCMNIFAAPASWTDVMAQALSFMAYGLRPRTYMSVSCGCPGPKTFRRFEIVVNEDGEPEAGEVEETDACSS